jgi:hypothetical protein
LTLDETINARDRSETLKAGRNARIEALIRIAQAGVTEGSAFLDAGWCTVGQSQTNFVFASIGTQITGSERFNSELHAAIRLFSTCLRRYTRRRRCHRCRSGRIFSILAVTVTAISRGGW